MKRIASVLLTMALLITITIPVMSLATVYGISENLENTGEMVVRIQTRLRDLGYFLFKPTGKFQSMTANAAVEFQKFQQDENGRAIMTDGTIGEQSQEILFSSNAIRSPIPPETNIPIGPGITSSYIQGEIVPWSEIKDKLEVGKIYQFTDGATGTVFKMVCTHMVNHAEMETASADDTVLFLSVFGECFNYSKRGMLLNLDGQQVICSMQGWPHGGDTVQNNDMTGKVCVYFDGSTSGVGKLQDVEHLGKIYDMR